jgi:hypothetical protein
MISKMHHFAHHLISLCQAQQVVRYFFLIVPSRYWKLDLELVTLRPEDALSLDYSERLSSVDMIYMKREMHRCDKA